MKIHFLKSKTIQVLIIAFINIIFSYNTVIAAESEKLNTMDVLNKFVYDNVRAFSGLAILLGVSIIGFKLIIHGTNPEERSNAMKAIFYVAIGSFIIGSCMLIFSFIITMKNELVSSDINPPKIEAQSEYKDMKDVAANFLERALTLPVDLIINSFVGGKTLSGISSESGLQTYLGFKTLDSLIFNKGKINSSDPFTLDEWNNLTALYGVVAGLTAPFIMIMIFKIGYSFVIYSNSVTKRVLLKEDIYRCIFSIFAISIAPVFVKGIFMMFNMLTLVLYNNIIEKSLNKFPFFELNFVNSIHTGSVLVTAIVKVIFVYLDFKINIIFLARKIVLVTMFAFTPIAAILWGINKNVNAAAIWFGEMITNASMNFFYGFTFCVMITALKSTGVSGWFYGMMWMFAIIKIADMLRNSLQGIFTKLSGIDEEQIGKQASGVVGGLIKGIAATAAGRAEVGGYFFNGKSATNMFNKNSINEPNNFSTDKTKQLAVARTNNDIGSKNSEYKGEQNIGDNVSHNNKSINSKIDNKKSGLDERIGNQSKYAGILQDNYKNEIGLNDVQNQVLRDVSNFVSGSIGKNSTIGSVANAVSKISDMNLRSKAAGKAINSTIKTIMEDSISSGQIKTESQAMQILFGGDNEEQSRVQKNKFIKAVSKGNYKMAEKIIVRTNPYVTPDSGFKWA